MFHIIVVSFVRCSNADKHYNDFLLSQEMQNVNIIIGAID